MGYRNVTLRSKMKLLPVVIALGGAAVTAAACSSSSSATGAQGGGTASSAGTATASTAGDPSKVTLTIGGQNGGTGPLAEASGLYKNTPYQLKWTNESTATGEITAIEAGAINVATLGDLSLIFQQGSKSPAWTKATIPLQEVAFAEASDALKKVYPSFELVAAKNSGVHSLADLKGKKVAFAPGGDLNQFVIYSVKKANLTLPQVQQVDLASPLAAAALEAGRVDVAALSPAYAAAPLAAGAYVIATTDDPGLQIPAAGTYFVRTSDLNNPDFVAALKDFLARTVQFQAWSAKNVPAVAAADVRYLNQSTALAQFNAKSTIEQFEPITPNVVSTEQQAADILHQYGALQNKIDVSIDYSTVFNQTIEDSLAKLSAS